ncbi:methyl-accepting chemotaxis protein [Clostridium polynesiense]|uniref:methyl-accepting chemotaxis protein n=1 Tax=Clostridium polynesiense TaxID=1325933 RepID=UPI00058D33DE|nr:methyl-accepting chemotaxis protein [Clostridium polynesiense]
MSLGMRFKTALIVSLIVIISLSSISVTGYLFSKKYILETNDHLIEKTAEVRSNEVESFINDAVTKVEGIALLEGLENVSPEEGVKTLSKVFPFYKDTFDNISFANGEGTRWNYKGEKDSIADRAYFKEAMSTKKPSISDVLISNTTGKLSVVVAAPILDSSNNAKGIAYATLSLAKLQEITEKLKYGTSGFGFIFDKNGVLLSNGKDSSSIGKLKLSSEESSSELKGVWENREKSSEEKHIKYNSGGKTAIAIVHPILINGKDNWYFSLSVNEEETLTNINKLSTTFILISCGFIIAAVLVSILYSSKITNPITRLSNITQFIAEGDLREKNIIVNSKDEIGKLTNSIILMSNNLRNIVKSIIGKAELLAASSEELSASTEEFAASAQSVASTIVKVQGDNLNQKDEIQQSRDEVDEGLALIDNLSVSIREIIGTVEENANVAENGHATVQEAINQMNQILDASKELQNFIEKLDAKSSEIGAITSTITSIAAQTNLLALNAAIEAARAGESGKGFSVVAEEVRNLAEKSQESAGLISKLINETQKDTSSAVDEMTNFLVKISAGAEVVSNAGDIFKRISKEIKESAENMTGMTELLNSVSEGSKKINEAISRIEIASSATTDNVESISTDIKEQTENTENIAASAESLSKWADELVSMVSKFQV